MVEWRLGEGGMAQVYLARDVRLGRDVAVKVLDRKLADRPGFRERFMREARVAAALDHPNIVPLFDFGDAEALYLVMPFVSGGSLQDVLSRTPLPVGEVVTFGSQIADALEYAHQRKVVHRDVKPANMLVHADGRLMLSDFGLAKIVNATHTLQAPRNRPDAGTPEYMAPEQVTGNSDSRSDIYGLGVVLYLLLTGRLPFSGASSHEVMQAHLYQDPPPIHHYNPSVPASMEAVVMRAMAKQPLERFQRAGELGAALLSALIAGATSDIPPAIMDRPFQISSHDESRSTGQRPIVMPPPIVPPAAPPWRQRVTSVPAQSLGSLGSSIGSSIHASGASAIPPSQVGSEWGAQRSASSLTGILPELNLPFTSLEAASGATSGGGQVSGANQSGIQGPSGARSSMSGLNSPGSFTGASGASSAADSQTTGMIPGIPNARTMGRMPAVAPTFSATGGSSPAPVAPLPFDMTQTRQQTRQPDPFPTAGTMGTMGSMAQGRVSPAAPLASPQAQPADLRATLPGSRMTEPPSGAQITERRSRLWIVVAALLIVMLIAVVILLRWLEAGPAGFMLFAFQ
ncbi:MAG TPA: serine/threonine-protein kinase [Ktedonobacterales bacterium]|nr:serine/threonine-protein kinase [Ktedonobacterales bacterium]